MRFRASTILVAAILAAIFGIPARAPAAEAGPQPAGSPNVLLVTLDTTRADALGAFGGRGARTPVLDALAARGTRWAQAIAPTALTLPASPVKRIPITNRRTRSSAICMPTTPAPIDILGMEASRSTSTSSGSRTASS